MLAFNNIIGDLIGDKVEESYCTTADECL